MSEELADPLTGVYLGLAAVLGLVAAWWLRRQRYYQRPDDPVRKLPDPWWVPALSVLGTALAAPFWTGGPSVVLVTYIVALVWSVSLAMVDLLVQRLPDQLVLPGYPGVAVLLSVCAVQTGEGGSLLRAAACAGFSVLAFLSLALISARLEGLGLGDVKLAGVLGALLGWFGWYPALVGLAAGFVLGGVSALVLLLLRRVNRGSSIAFGPAMVLGAYLCGLVAPVL